MGEFDLKQNSVGEVDQTTQESGQIITTSADVTLNGGLIRELPQNPLNSGLGIILICPEESVWTDELQGLFSESFLFGQQ